MSGLGGDLLLALGVAAAGFGSSYLTNRRSNRTAAGQVRIDEGKLELEGRREDGAAYERASRINEQIVDGLREELTALQDTIRTLRVDLRDAERHSAHLENHVRDLEATAHRMRDLLTSAGIRSPEIPQSPV